MNSGLSTADGAGLGTWFYPTGSQGDDRAGGFPRIPMLDIENPMNNYYLMRK